MMFPLLLLFSCSEQNRIISVYTDIPEAVLLINQFNNTQSDYTARVVFSDLYENGEEDESIDIILGRSLHTPEYMEKMTSLDRFRENSYIASIYPEVLQACTRQANLKLLPLSIDLPVLLQKKGEIKGKIADWEEVTNGMEVFNTVKEDHLVKAGFSPLWSDDFLLSYLSTDTVSFQDFLNDPQKGYQSKTENLAAWIGKYNKDQEEIHHFMDKYMYIPYYRLLAGDRTGFSINRLTEYILLPDEVTNQLSFRYFGTDGYLQPLQIISAGIPLKSSAPEGAEAFLLWLMEDETWDNLYREIIQNRDSLFGLNGISASYRVNETILTGIYPALKGMIPYPGEFERIPQPVPQWEKVLKEVLMPQIRENLQGEIPSTNMSETYEKWLLLNPDPLFP